MAQDQNTYLLSRLLREEKGMWREEKSTQEQLKTFQFCLELLGVPELDNNESDLGDTLFQFFHFMCRENIVQNM